MNGVFLLDNSAIKNYRHKILEFREFRESHSDALIL